MDAIELLMQDHKRIRMLFEGLEQQGQGQATSTPAMMADNEDGALAAPDPISARQKATTPAMSGTSSPASSDGTTTPTSMSNVNRTPDRALSEAMSGMGASSPAQPGMGSLLSELAKVLSLHAVIEEQNFYPALAAMPQVSDLLKDAYHDHADMKVMLGQLVMLEPTDPAWMQQLSQLKQTVETHVAEEENELFKQLDGLMPIAQRQALGLQLEQAKAINLPGVLTSLPAQMVQMQQVASGEAALPVPGGLSNLLLSRQVSTAMIGDYAMETQGEAQQMINNTGSAQTIS